MAHPPPGGAPKGGASSSDEAPTVARPKAEGAASMRAAYGLVVLDGPAQGTTARIDESLPSRVLVGQSPVCQLKLEDPHASRRHAAFDLVGARLRVTDLASTNGTWVNGVAVTEAFLRGGEVLQIGGTTLRVDVGETGPEARLTAATNFGRVVGASPAMRKLYPLFERLAASDVPVLIEGETGTGKEVLAEALHEKGPRASKPFVVFDCTTAPASLLESSLFGHERGAFTGATEARRGVFEEADGGTLFIDEIGDLDVALQAKLLRAIQRSEVQHIGSNKWTKVDVRVLAATRRDLDRLIQEGKFRDDLFFRLAVTRIELPPLRDRAGDVPVLAQHFWRTLAGRSEPFPHDFLPRYEDYGWPGNLRELYNAVARHVALGSYSDLFAFESPSSARGGSMPPPAANTASATPGASDAADAMESILVKELPWPRARQAVLDEFTRRFVERTLARYGGNTARAAAASGIALRYFRVLRSRQSG